MDPRISRGFSYKIRILGTERYLFDGHAVTVCSVGMGYGKRISTSDGHFYSDTHSNGLGFSLQVMVSLPSYRPIIYCAVEKNVILVNFEIGIWILPRLI